MKIRPVEAESFRADRRTDITKLIVALRNSVNTPNMSPQTCTYLPLLGLHPKLSMSLRYTADFHTTRLTRRGLCDRHCE